jgi:hypothetical protein
VEQGGAVNSGKYGVISIIWIVVYSFVNKIVWDYFLAFASTPFGTGSSDDVVFSLF